MTRISPLALAVVLLLVSPASLVGPSLAAVDVGGTSAGGVDATATPAAASTATSDRISWLTIGAEGTTGYGNATGDIGSALGADHTQLQARFESHAIEREFQNADSPAARQAVINQSIAAIEADTHALHEREQRLASRYAAGDLSDKQFLRDLASIRSEAKSLQATAQTVDQLAQDNPSVEVERHRLVGQLSRYDTPLRVEIAAALRADAETIDPIQITVSEDQLVLSRVNGTTYVRETVQYDAYRPYGEIQFDSLLEVGERGAELYPWIYDNSRDGNSYRWYNTMMWLRVEHDRGEIQAYVDSTTRDVVLEHHRLNLHELSTTPTVSKTTDELSVAANRVPDGGPIRVNVTGAESDEPVDARVDVDGLYTAETGDDGTVWIPAPEGTTTVTASVGTGAAAENVSVTVLEPAE
jgi:hypothetical protein